MRDKPNPAHRREMNTEESQVGRAHHALRAYVKSFTVLTNASHSFLIAADRRSASILNGGGETVLVKSIAELASEGAQVRLALVALRDVKEKLESEQPPVYARYCLDVRTGEADLKVAGVSLTRDELKVKIGGKYRGIESDPVAEAVDALEGNELLSIQAWARVGRPIAAGLFNELASAESYGFEDAAQALRERAYRLGLIHRPGVS